MIDLAGKRAVITGSSTGIGNGIAKFLAANGVKVIINARGSGEKGKAAIDEVVEEIRASGGIAEGIAAAIDEPASAEAIVNKCVESFGGIDILINNAAVMVPETLGPIGDCPVDLWDQHMRINLNGAFYVTRAALPHMVKQRWGRILNAASYAGTGKMGGSAYSTSKSALFGFTCALASDYGPYGITANAYNPEARTPMGDSQDPAVYKQMVDYWMIRGFRTPADISYLRDLGYPDGVAPWVAYLCSEQASNLNGHVFAVESRRMAVLASPEEERVLYHDYAGKGPVTLEELELLAPMVFPLENRWPRREGDDLAKWESVKQFG